MGSQNWVETLDSIVADGTQVSNTAVETIVSPDFNIPAYYMVPGRTLTIWAFGLVSNVVTAQPTITFKVRWGGLSGAVLLASGAQSTSSTAFTNALWMLDARIVCRTAGASGLFMSGGQCAVFNVDSAVAGNLKEALLGSAGNPGASGNTTVTVDTTSAKLLSVSVTFSAANASNNLTCQQRIIQVIN